MLYSTLLSAAVVTLQLSQTTLAFAIPPDSSSSSVDDLMIRSSQGGDERDDDKIIPFPYDENDAPEIENVFGLIEDIPDETFDQGDQAVKDWIKTHRSSSSKGGDNNNNNKARSVVSVSVDSNNLETREAAPVPVAVSDPYLNKNTQDVIEKRSWIEVAKCALAILQAIAENEFPIAKLRRIKAIVKLLGGAKKTAKLLLKAKSLKQLLVIGGPELAELGEILFNFRGIVGACFSF